jgi:hypothetical protein
MYQNVFHPTCANMRKLFSSTAITMLTFCSRSMVDIKLLLTVDPIQGESRLVLQEARWQTHRTLHGDASSVTRKDEGVLTLPPQLMHMDFNPDGLVRNSGTPAGYGCHDHNDSCGKFTYGSRRVVFASFSLLLFIGIAFVAIVSLH